MRVLQINSSVNIGSTGRITGEIGKMLWRKGHKSYIAAANISGSSNSSLIPIGTAWDRQKHALKTRILDRHGFASAKATRKMVEDIQSIDPDVIHLHNIHGYYLNAEVLFTYLKKVQKPAVWTLHDCWPFTGHCAYFDRAGCYKWQTECYKCPLKKAYPASWGLDRSRENFHEKRELFTGLNQCMIVTPSQWLASHVQQSFLKGYPVEVIRNGVDQETFHPGPDNGDVLQKYEIADEPYVLGVASVWSPRKGFNDFLKLRQMLPESIYIVLVGLTQNQRSKLVGKMIGIKKTADVRELAALYSGATAFANPTYIDNFPTTNIEALSCGTPVVTYNTGGSPEAIDEDTGMVVEKGDVRGLANALQFLATKGKVDFAGSCRARAKQYFNKEERYLDYIRLYEKLTSKMHSSLYS
jgi:glycosyltransferase involved in cell wall biosynthesis